jgi:hypothetical protein
LAVEALALGFVHHPVEIVIIDDIVLLGSLGASKCPCHIAKRYIVLLRTHIRRSARGDENHGDV